MNGVFKTVVCTLALSFPNTLFGQVTLDIESIDASAEVTAVTLYRGRASVTRNTELQLEPGAYALYFYDLPQSAQLDSIQAHVSGNAKLLSVDTAEIPVATSNVAILDELNTAIESLEAQIQSLSSNEAIFKLQTDLLTTLIQQNINAESGPDLQVMDEQLLYVKKTMSEISANRIANANVLETTKEELQALKRRRSNIASDNSIQRNAVVDIAVLGNSVVTVDLTYLVHHASWSPTYAIRASKDTSDIQIDYDAEIYQRTGEVWKDVSITLSTAQPQDSVTPPMPRPWLVDIYEPVVLGAELKSVADAPPNPSAGRGRNALSLGASHAYDEIEAYAELTEAAGAATVEGGGPAVNFVIPRTLIVPSNAKEKITTAIASISMESDSYRVAVPMLTDKVFIQSEVKNTSEFILLPGHASIFYGSDYVGKTHLATVTPNETFEVNLGVDEMMSAQRTLVEKQTGNTGLFGSGKQTKFDYRIELSNGHGNAIDTRVWDRMPISQNEKIEIKLLGTSSPLSTNQKYLEDKHKQGILRWDLSVPASSTGQNSFTLTWSVEVSRSKDIEITPLPE